MPRRALGPELKRVPFRATVTPQDQKWIDETVGLGRRWPTTSALIEDAFVFMRELASLEAAVRRDYLRQQAEQLRQAQRRATAVSAPLEPLPEAPAALPVTVAATPEGGRVLAPLQRLPRMTREEKEARMEQAQKEVQEMMAEQGEIDPDEGAPRGARRIEIPDEGSASASKSGSIPFDQKTAYEEFYQSAVALQRWPEAQQWAEALGTLDDEPRLVFEDGYGGQVYQRGSKREYRGPAGFEGGEAPLPR